MVYSFIVLLRHETSVDQNYPFPPEIVLSQASLSKDSQSEARDINRLPSSPNMFPRSVLIDAILRASVVVTLLQSVNPIL